MISDDDFSGKGRDSNLGFVAVGRRVHELLLLEAAAGCRAAQEGHAVAQPLHARLLVGVVFGDELGEQCARVLLLLASRRRAPALPVGRRPARFRQARRRDHAIIGACSARRVSRPNVIVPGVRRVAQVSPVSGIARKHPQVEQTQRLGGVLTSVSLRSGVRLGKQEVEFF